MIKKDNLRLMKILLIIVFLFIQVSFVSSEDIRTFTESTNIGELFGLNKENITASAGIEYSEIKDPETEEKGARLTFIEENAEVKINEDLFSNIVPQEAANHPTYIKLDENGKIISADFTVSEEGGNYTFGNNTIEVPPNSRVLFDEDIGIKIKIPDETDLREFPDLLNYISNGYLTTIKGKEIILPDGINLIDGELRIEEKGYFLEEGDVIYKQNLLKADRNNKRILIANSDADLLNYEGNWIKQTVNTLELQSTKKGLIEIDFLEDHEILNTDNKDRLSVIVQNGDGLKFEERVEEGLIPRAIHKSSERGETVIFNDKIETVFNKGGFFILPKALEIGEGDFISNKYQSSAFEIQSDSPEIDNKLRINSYRQFVILSEDNKEVISYNKYGLPISANIKDNELQTIEQLREKYPGIEFECPEYTTNERSRIVLNMFNEKNLPPYLIYLTDNYLESNPNAVEDFDKIEYSDVFSAHVIESTMMLGRRVLDPTASEFIERPIRDIISPLQILKHEHEHRMDYIIMDKEEEILKSLDDQEINNFFEKIGPIQQEFDNLIEQRNEYGKYSKEWKEIDKKCTEKDDEFKKIKGEIMEVYYNRYPEKSTLIQKYNELAISSTNEISTNREFNQLYGTLVRDIQENYIRTELDEIVRREYGLDFMDFIASKFDFETRDDVLKLYREYMDNPGLIERKVIENIIYKEVETEEGETRRELDKTLQPETIFKLVELEKLLIITNRLENETRRDKDLIGDVRDFYYTLSNNNLITKRNQLEQITQINTGLPYIYASKNSNSGFDTVASAWYFELSSTYREQPIETRRMLVQSGNPLVRDTYKKLTQLAFDSGKMDVGEYTAIMGEEYCNEADCSDKLCIEYKLLCCEKHINSVNC